MTLKAWGAALVAAALLVAGAAAAGAQSGDKFTARLGWVPISGGDRGSAAVQAKIHRFLPGGSPAPRLLSWRGPCPTRPVERAS